MSNVTKPILLDETGKRIAQAVESLAQGNKYYVTPEMYGAKGDGTTDDSQAVQDAVDAGYNVQLADNKTYYLASAVTIDHDCHLIGGENTVIKTKTPSGGSVNSAFVISGTLKKTVTLTTDYVNTGNTDNCSNRFTLSDMDGIDTGDIMVITAEDQYYSYSRQYYYLGATLLIGDIYGGHIYTTDSMPWDVENTENVSVKIYSAPVAIIENIHFVSDLDSIGAYSYFIDLEYCKNSVIKNCTFKQFGKGICLLNCYGVTIEGINLAKSKYDNTMLGDGYGVFIASCSNTIIDRVNGICSQSCIDLSGFTPNINTYIYNCNVASECRASGIGMHENAYNTVIEDCVLGGLSLYGTAKVNRCNFYANRRISDPTAIILHGNYNEKWSRFTISGCKFDGYLEVQISRPSPQEPVQSFQNIIGSIEIDDCVGGMLDFVPNTTADVTANIIKYMLLNRWSNCYEFYHTSGNVVENMEIRDCSFINQYWINKHEDAINYDYINSIEIKSTKPQKNILAGHITKNGKDIYLPSGVKISFSSNNQTDHYIVCGKNIASNNPNDYINGSVTGSVGGDITFAEIARLSSSLTQDQSENLVFTQPNDYTGKGQIFLKCMAYITEQSVVKMSVKLKNTGETEAQAYRPYIAIVSCGTGKITYIGNGTNTTATADGAVATHQRSVPANSLVLCYLSCSSTVANAQTTFENFVVKVFTVELEETIQFESYNGSSRDGDGDLESVDGLNYIMASVRNFNAKFRVNLLDNA